MPKERQLPRVSVWVGLAIAVPFAALAWWAAGTGSFHWWGFLMVGVVPVTGYVYWALRPCPGCRGRMRREERPDERGRPHVWLDCPACDIRWNTGQAIPVVD